VSVTVWVFELHPTELVTEGADALSVAVPVAVIPWLAWPVVLAVAVPVTVAVE